MADSTDPVARLNQLTSGIDFAMLTTVRADGVLHSCPMATHPAESGGVLWFFASNYSQKADALKTDPRVNLAYCDPAGGRYVSVSGNCELVRDQKKAQQLWKDAYQAWLPKGLSDPDLILLKVDIGDVEYWDAASHTMGRLGGL